MDKSSPRVPIMEHPDVRRMLLVQKCHAEGMRALCFYAASLQDEREIMHVADHKAAQLFDRRNDLLLPLIKGYCSEKVYELLAVSLQCFGGSGYLADYPIEQYIRDQKIDSLYEGTTHIQALDLLLRKSRSRWRPDPARAACGGPGDAFRASRGERTCPMHERLSKRR
jgi:alkylation response protein AidB-like acyl-CoA dehydrogenase